MEPRALEAMLLVALHRSGPLGMASLAELVPAEASELETTLQRLLAAGMIQSDTRNLPALFRCDTCVIQFGDEAGWEAAVFDHYQAMVVAIATKLRSGARRADLADSIGGSTFVFDVWNGHPLQAAVLGYLKSMRDQGMQLRAAVEQHNAGISTPAGVTAQRVTAYVGQSVAESDGGDHA